MAWPANLKNIRCVNFTPNFLPILRKAIERNMIVWGKPSLFIDQCSAPFEWAGCKWELEEHNELVVSIKLLEGDLHTEDLTVAMLRG